MRANKFRLVTKPCIHILKMIMVDGVVRTSLSSSRVDE